MAILLVAGMRSQTRQIGTEDSAGAAWQSADTDCLGKTGVGRDSDGLGCWSHAKQ